MPVAPPINNVKSFHKGQVIFKEGQPADYAYLIKTGSVVIYRLIDEKRVVLERLGPGQMFGEMGVLGDAPRSANALADDFTEAMSLDRDYLGQALSESPKIIQKLARLSLERLRRTTQKVRPPYTPNIFLSVCHILELAARAQPPAKPARQGRFAKPEPAQPAGLPYPELIRKIKEIINISLMEVEDHLKRLRSLRVIKLNFTKGQGNFWDCTIQVPDPKALTEVAKGFAKQFGGDEGAGLEPEYIDIFDFAQLVEAPPQAVLRKIGEGELPNGMLFLKKDAATQFAQAVGKEFFQKAKKARSRLKNLSGVDDLIQVDAVTLQEVFSQLGHYKLSLLYGIAGDAARECILGNLSSATAHIIQDEAEGRGSPDPDEAADVEFEAIALIKKLKKVDA